VAGTVRTLELDTERCAAAVDAGMLATELADFLVRSGLPFREAHERVGRLVRAAEQLRCSVDELPREVYLQVAEEFAAADLDSIFDPQAALSARSGAGGTGGAAVREQLTQLRGRL
jgi:argininosuccinate lyase